MDTDSRLPWIIALILLFLSAFFALAETAISSVSKTRMKTAAERGDPRAEKALYVLEHFDQAISTILICTNIVHLSAATVVTVAVTRKWGLGAVTLSTLLSTLVIFFAGEMLPKSMAKHRSEAYTLSVSGILCLLMKLLKPLSALLTVIGQGAAKLTKGEPEVSVTEDELYDIIEDMTEEGTLNEEQGDLISSALQFGDVTVESILTPRVDVVAVDIRDSAEEILRVMKETNHSRLPVYERSIDNIVGFLQIRSFIAEYLKKGAETDVRALTDEVCYAHQSTNIDELLQMMTRERTNMAVITDNYGGTLGIVTIEDILEELVGEIWDEDDVVEENVTELGENLWLADAEESVEDVFERIGYEDPEENEELVNTLMGEWAYEQFDHIPDPGDTFRYHGVEVTVSDVEHNRIRKLKVALLPEEPEGGSEE